MGIFTYTDPQTNKTYKFEHGGDAPTEKDYAEIGTYLQGERTAFADKYKQAFGTEAPVADDGTALGRGWTSGMQSAKGGLGELLQTTGNRLGWSGLEDYGTGMEQNAVQEAGMSSLTNPAPLGWQDVHGIGSGLTYLGEMAGSSAPIMGAGIVGAGLGTLAAAAAPELAIGAGVAGAVGAGLATLPFYTGENLQEQEKISGEGNVNLTKALGAGAFQSALDAASLKVLGRLGVGKAALSALEGEVGQGLTKRLLTGATEGVLTEGTTETLQQLATIYQAGGDLNSPEAQSQLIDAFVGGAVLGGVAGGAGRGLFGKRVETPKPNDEVIVDQTKADESKAPMLALPAPKAPIVAGPAVEIPSGPTIVTPAPGEITPAALEAAGVPKGNTVYRQLYNGKITGEEARTKLVKLAQNKTTEPALKAAVKTVLAANTVPAPKPNTAVVATQEAQDQAKAPEATVVATALPVTDIQGPDWLKENVAFAREQADRQGITGKIEDLFAEGLTAAQVRMRLENDGDLNSIDQTDRQGFVASVRASLGIPSQMAEEGKTEFAAWQQGYNTRKAAPSVVAPPLSKAKQEKLDAIQAKTNKDTATLAESQQNTAVREATREAEANQWTADEEAGLAAAEAAVAAGEKPSWLYRNIDELKAKRDRVQAAAATKEAAPEAVDALEAQVNEVVQKPIVPAPVAEPPVAETPVAPAPTAETPVAETPVAPVAETAAPPAAAPPAAAYNAVGQGQVTGLPEQNIPSPNIPRTERPQPAIKEAVIPVDDEATVTTLLSTVRDQLNAVGNKAAKNAHTYFSKSPDLDFMLDFMAADAMQPGTPEIRRASKGKSLAPLFQGTGKTAALSAISWVRANMSPKAVKQLEAHMRKYEMDTSVATSSAVDEKIKAERAQKSEQAQAAEYYESLIPGSADKAAAARARNTAPKAKEPTLPFGTEMKGLFKRAAQSISFGLEEALHPAIVAALRAGNLRDALEGVSLTSADPYVRNMATKLMAFVGTTKVYTTYNNAEAVRMLQNKSDPSQRLYGAYMLMSKADYDVVAAKYPAYAAYIQNAIFLDEGTGMNAQTLIHEMVHAAVAQELLGRPNGPVATRLEALRKDALKQLGSLEYDETLHSYGFTNVHEFAAEALSNQDFQMELDRIFPNDRKASGLVQFVQEFSNFVRRILGRPEKDYRRTSTFDEVDFLTQSVFNVAPEFGGSQPMYNRAMQPTKAKQVLTAVGKLAGPFAEVDSLQTARAVSRSVALDLTRPAMPAILNLFTPVRNLVTLAEKYFPETAMAVYASLAGQKSFEQSLNTEIANTMKQVTAFLTASPEKAALFHSFRTRASRYEIDVRRPESFYSKYALAYYPLKADGTPGERVFEEFNSFEERKDKIDALNKAEAAGAKHTRARAINDPDPETLALYKKLKKEYESLGKAGQDAYNQVLGVFEAMHYETAKAVKDRINAMLPDTADTDNAHTRNILLRSIYNKIFAEKGLMVYQPLQRSGEFKLTYNGIHPTTNTTENFVHSFDTAAQRDKALDLLRALPKEFNISNIETPLQKIGDPFGSRRSPPPAFVADVTRLITKGAQQDAVAARKRILAQGGTQVDADAEYTRVLTEVKDRAEKNNRAIVELALDAMPESSIFNAYRARQNVSGFIGDLSPLKAAFDAIEGPLDSVDTSNTLLQTKLSSMVHQVSAIRHQAESAKIMAAMTAQMELIRTTMPEDAANARVYYDALAESLKNPTIRRSKLAAGMNTGAFVWTLFGNVSSAAVNTMGVMLVVYPRLAARYGAVKAAKIMLRSLRDIANSGRSRMEPVIGADGKRTMQAVDTGATGRSVRNYTFGDVDFAQGYTTGANDTNTLKYLVNEGMQRHMFVDSSIYDYLDSNKSGLGAFADKMLHLGAAPMHHTERIIRESTMIANYRLELQAAAKRKGTAVLTEADMQAAAKFAVEQTELMTGTTPSTAAPNWAQKGIMPMIAMYKRYPLAMMHLLLGDIANALPGKAKLEALHGAGTEAFKNALESRKIARLQVAGQLGALALFSGAMGLPLYGMFSDLFDAMFTDDDEEKFDFLVRRNLGELGSKGILNYLLGVDIASRIGMSDIFYRAPLRAADQKFSQNILEGAMGPAAGLITGTLPRAMDLYNQGEYFRALEAAMPAAVRNGFRAYRFATTGSAESLRGDVISDIGPGSVLSQALGFAPAAYVRQLELSSAAKQVDVAIATKKSALLRRMNLARRNRDRVETQAILADINEFNRKHPSKRITADTIKRSENTFKTTTSRVRNGVVYSDLGLPELQPAFDMMDEPVTIWD